MQSGGSSNHVVFFSQLVFWFGFAGVHAGYYSLHCYPAPCPGYKAGHYSLHCYPGDVFLQEEV